MMPLISRNIVRLRTIFTISLKIIGYIIAMLWNVPSFSSWSYILISSEQKFYVCDKYKKKIRIIKS